MQPQSFSRPLYRADIDGLRAIAILSVLFFHAYPDSSFISGGFVGVDIFFVISGYLISSIIFRGLELNTFSFFDFYARRVRRIFPAVSIVLLGSLGLGFFLLTAYEFEDLVRETPYAAFFAENWRLYSSTGGYWDLATELRPLMHFWSLGVEEQYYVLYPLLCFAFWKISSKRFLICLVIAFVISFGLCLYDTVHSPIRAFYSLHARFWELLAGGILAYIEVKWPKYKECWGGVTLVRCIDNFAACAGALFIFLSIGLFTQGSDFPGWKALVPVLGTFLVIAAGSKTVLNTLLANKLFVFIGLISYPLYLWHWPLICIARNNLSDALPTGILMISILGLSFVLAYLTYILVERPMRSKRATLQMCVALSIILLIQTVGLKTLIRKSETIDTYIKSSLPTNVQTVFFEAPKSSEIDSLCAKKFGEGYSVCKQLSDNPKVLIWGDSHNYLMWNHFYKENLQPDVYLVGKAALVIFEDAYRLKAGTADMENAKLTKNMWTVLSNSPDIKTVVLRGFWSSYLTVDDGIASTKYPNLNGIALEQQLWKDTFSRLAELEKNVILVLDNIDVDYDPLDKYFLPRRFHLTKHENTESVLVKYKEINQSHIRTREFIKQEALQWSNITVIDSWDALCNKEGCYLAKNNIPYYKDDDHLSIFGNALVWALIQEKINTIN